MTLPSRHRILNSRTCGLRPSTLPLGHAGSAQYWIFTNLRVSGEKTFYFFETSGPEGGVRIRDLRFSKQAALTTCTKTLVIKSKSLYTIREGWKPAGFWGISWHRLFILNPLTAKIIQLEFSPTWRCVSLTRSLHCKSKNISNGRNPIPFKWIRKSWLRQLWWFQIDKNPLVSMFFMKIIQRFKG